MTQEDKLAIATGALVRIVSLLNAEQEPQYAVDKAYNVALDALLALEGRTPEAERIIRAL